jgi:hypothetical protein
MATADGVPERERMEVALEALDVVMGRLDAFTHEEAELLIRFTDNTLAVIVSRLSGGGVPSPGQSVFGGLSPPLRRAA